MKKTVLFLSLMLVWAIALTSCGSAKHVSYFQDTQKLSASAEMTHSPIVLRPDDKISILVHSRDMQLANIFNLPYVSRMLGSDISVTTNSQGMSGYNVDKNGCIDFPVIGAIKVEGLSRNGVEQLIKSELVRRSLIKDPVVTVDFLNLRVGVLGEVTRPGRYAIDHDEYTILDAISAAGDLTIYGKRNQVKVLRTEDGVKKTYIVDLTNTSSVINSPVYFLRQNDVVYVEPNLVRARQSTAAGNTLLTPSFWVSASSLFVTIATLVINIVSLSSRTAK